AQPQAWPFILPLAPPSCAQVPPSILPSPPPSRGCPDDPQPAATHAIATTASAAPITARAVDELPPGPPGNRGAAGRWRARKQPRINRAYHIGCATGRNPKMLAAALFLGGFRDRAPGPAPDRGQPSEMVVSASTFGSRTACKRRMRR